MPGVWIVFFVFGAEAICVLELLGFLKVAFFRSYIFGGSLDNISKKNHFKMDIVILFMWDLCAIVKNNFIFLFQHGYKH